MLGRRSQFSFDPSCVSKCFLRALRSELLLLCWLCGFQGSAKLSVVGLRVASSGRKGSSSALLVTIEFLDAVHRFFGSGSCPKHRTLA